tara:strand:- start:1169 stop:2281 length:1113 start_codon:yes stop_codon:yes gene_type:complete
MQINFRFFQKPHYKILVVGYLIILLSCINLSQINPNKIISIYTLKQFFWLSLSILFTFVIFRFRLRSIKDISLILYLFSIILLIFVLIFGREISGAKSWIKFWGLSFQPTELVKISYIFLTAKIYSELGSYSKSLLIKYFIGLSLFLIPFILILLQPDFGSAFILFLISMTVVISFSFNKKFLLSLLLIGIFLAIPIWNNYLEPYQKQRIINFIKPENDPRGFGYNAIQSKISVGSGGIFGKGIGNSSQAKLGFLPENHTDFAFSVWAEQTGLFGSLILILLYFFLIIYPITFISRINDLFLKVIIFGLSSYFFLHFIINLFMTVGLFPIIGIPMILFSYGGSSLICASFAFSIQALIISAFRDVNRLGV